MYQGIDVQAEDKWQLALDASGDAMWDVNLETGDISFSDKWCDIFGYDKGAITTTQQWLDKLHPDDRVIAHKIAESHINGKSKTYAVEIRYKCKDGHYKWILSRGEIVARKEDGTPLRFIGTHKDIEKRKAEEAELKTSQEIFSNFFNHSGVGKAMLAPGGKWIAVNDVICKLTEYTKEELLQFHYHDITYPDDVYIDLPYIQKLREKKIPSYTIEKRYISKSRKIIYVSLTVTLIWEDENTPKYFICDIVDITANKELMEALSRQKSELENTSVNLMNKVNQLEELNHIIAHNLRGPIGNIKFLSEESGVFSTEEALSMINESANSLLDSLNLLMSITRIKLDKEVPSENCSVAQIVDDIVKQQQAIIYQEEITIEKNLQIQHIHYPKPYLDSILYNLISNAIKYRKPETRAVIKVSTRFADDKIQLSVKDNGLGIDLDKYADRVFKLNQVFHTGYDSKGVGLFITKTQVESLGGTIEVKSQLNEGCEFIITF
jgi:PAS domain S-box-containing protein